MAYNGPERRTTQPIVPIRHFVLATFALGAFIALLFFLTLSETSQAEGRLARIEAQQRASNEVAENAKVVADFIRDCIFYAEEGRCPVKNLQIIKEDNPTGNPKPSTTTTTHG